MRKTRLMRPRGRGAGRRGCSRPCAWRRTSSPEKLARLQHGGSETTLIDRIEVRYKAIVDDQVDLIRRFKPDGTITFVNKAYCHFYQKRPEDLLGTNIKDLLASEEREGIIEALASLTPENPYVVTEPSFRRQGGEVHWVEFLNQAVYDESGNVAEYQSVGRDITSLKQAELRIQEAQTAMTRATRMATLAVVGGGIAHEINQPLNAIRILAGSGLYMYEHMDPPPHDRIKQILRDVSEQVGRIDSIVMHMRDFLRTNQTKPFAHCDINESVESALNILRSQLAAAGVRVHTDLAVDLPRVYGVRVRFEEIVLNLVGNAMQALEDCEEDDRRIVVRTWQDGGVRLSVTDNGPGLPEECRERLFEPFFTTKSTSKAMGLGLSIIRTILASCKGTISVTNGEDGGAHFEIVFPLTIDAEGSSAQSDMDAHESDRVE